jgi:hypothetical protein
VILATIYLSSCLVTTHHHPSNDSRPTPDVTTPTYICPSPLFPSLFPYRKQQQTNKNPRVPRSNTGSHRTNYHTNIKSPFPPRENKSITTVHGSRLRKRQKCVKKPSSPSHHVPVVALGSISVAVPPQSPPPLHTQITVLKAKTKTKGKGKERETGIV